MRGDLSADIALQRGFVRRGERGALESLLGVYGPKLYGYLVRATGDGELARKGLLHVARRLAEAPYDGDRRLFAGWLFSLAVEAARKVGSARPSARRAEEPLPQQIVGALPADLREAFLLSHYMQLLPEEIALALKIPTEAAVSRVERAVDEVRTALHPALPKAAPKPTEMSADLKEPLLPQDGREPGAPVTDSPAAPEGADLAAKEEGGEDVSLR